MGHVTVDLKTSAVDRQSSSLFVVSPLLFEVGVADAVGPVCAGVLKMPRTEFSCTFGSSVDFAVDINGGLECSNMSSDISSSSSTAAANDTFPEVAFFEVPNDASKSSNTRHKELVKHPAFRQISAINGEINKMNVKHLKIELERLNFDGRGSKDVLKKRLKAYERSRILKEAGVEDPNTDQQHYTHIVVIDFEATCEEHQTKDYVHEIIEFPAVLVRVSDAARVGEFHSLVRPVLNPVLSEFCRQLTGIDQRSVDAAPTFPEVLHNFENWLAEQGVSSVIPTAGVQAPHGTESALASPDAHTGLQHDGGVASSGLAGTFAVATDGPWDMARFLLMQCSVSELPFPSWARSWINLRKVFSNFYAVKRLCLSEMLSALGMEFEGRPHCGLDDARNIAVIAEALLRDGASPRVNETIAHLPHCAPPSLKGSSVANVTLKDFKSSQRRRHKSSCTSVSDHTDEVRPATVSDRQTACDGGGYGSGGDSGVSCSSGGDGGVGYSNSGDVGLDYYTNGDVGVGCNNSGDVSCSNSCDVGVSSENSCDVGDSCSSGSDVGASYNNGVDFTVINNSGGVKIDTSNASENYKRDSGDGGLKAMMKELCGEVHELNVDFSSRNSQKLISCSSTESGGDVVVNGRNCHEESTSRALNFKHPTHSNAPDKINRNVESNTSSPNVAYHNISYSNHVNSSNNFAPHFSNNSTGDSDVLNRYPDSRTELRSDKANTQSCNFIAHKPDHSTDHDAQHGKTTTREPLPYNNCHDSRYMHYTQINSRANKFVNRKDHNDVQGNSSSLASSEQNSRGRKKIHYTTPANGKPGRRVNNHRPSQYSSGNGDERYAPKGRRPPHFRRDGVQSTSDRTSQGFYSNATTYNESSTHKNIDFNDSTQFPVLEPCSSVLHVAMGGVKLVSTIDAHANIGSSLKLVVDFRSKNTSRPRSLSPPHLVTVLMSHCFRAFARLCDSINEDIEAILTDAEKAFNASSCKFPYLCERRQVSLKLAQPISRQSFLETEIKLNFSRPPPPQPVIEEEQLPCRCDPECTKYGDCCMDGPSVRSPHGPGLSLTSEIPSTVSRGATSCLRLYPNDPYFPEKTIFMVNKCPSTAKESIAKKCHKTVTASKYSYLLDAPVVSEKSGVVYANFFCALCHDDNKIIRHNMSVICNCDLKSKSELRSMNYVHGELAWTTLSTKEDNCSRGSENKVCLASIQFPNDLGRECDIRVIDSCQDDWPVDVDRELCSSYNYRLQDNLANVYKNPTCARCNGVPEQNLDCIMPKLSLRFGDPRGLDVFLLSDLFSPNEPCEIDELYDNIYEECVKDKEETKPLNKAADLVFLIFMSISLFAMFLHMSKLLREVFEKLGWHRIAEGLVSATDTQTTSLDEGGKKSKKVSTTAASSTSG
ncbi:Exonuclease RNase T/DNA polymerase III [Trinorchestia longiramus]|nr:Exonuclease RNase T/DNA polymerase III [Trinorchestia longiramus]